MKFKKNTTVNLGGWNIKIRTVDKNYRVESMPNGFMGIYVPVDREILICEEVLNDTPYEEVVMHEMFHVLADYCGLPTGENFTALSNLLHSVIAQLTEEEEVKK